MGKKAKAFTVLHADFKPARHQVGAVTFYLWYEVQERVSGERSHCEAHKQLQEEHVRFLAGAEEDQADAKHGAHGDEQHSSRAVAVLCRQESWYVSMYLIFHFVIKHIYFGHKLQKLEIDYIETCISTVKVCAEM